MGEVAIKLSVESHYSFEFDIGPLQGSSVTVGAV